MIRLFNGNYGNLYVEDGNTVIGRTYSNFFTVLLAGIDAPESSFLKKRQAQLYCEKARIHLARLVRNKNVYAMDYGIDKCNRVLGVIFLENENININLEMLKAGLVEVYRGTPVPGLDLEPYYQAEKEAREANKGMWVLGDKYISPRDWRNMQRGKGTEQNYSIIKNWLPSKKC